MEEADKQIVNFDKIPAFSQGVRCAGLLSPMRGGAPEVLPPLHSPVRRALRPSTPGDFPDAGKVTKGAPRAVPFGIPRCVVAALFALAALRSVSRRATFCHKTRPICHFELVGKSVLFFPLVSSREHSVFSIRGTADSLPPRMLEGFIYINQYR